jgi:single-stranded DNA-binding protein
MMKLTIIGNLGSDPVQKSTETTKIHKFSVGVSVRRKKEFVTQWVEVVIFGTQFDKLIPTLSKGTKVCVTGSFDLSHDEKSNKTYWNVIPDSITIVMSPKSSTPNDRFSTSWPSKSSNYVGFSKADLPTDEDIPF